jgi:iron complex outermembrane receptor protein
VGADPSVATYIDDIPQIYPQMIPRLLDLERIELLKGAQGGLYGRNATGGVLNIITKQPNTDEFSGNVLASYGEKNTLQLAGYVNVPINDKVAFNVSAERDKHDGYVKNVAQPNPYTAAMFPSGSFLGTSQQTANFFNSGVNPLSSYGSEDIWSVKTKLLLKPSDNLKITIAYDYNNEDDTNGAQLYNSTPASGLAAIQNLFNAFGITTNFPAGFLQQPLSKFTTSRADTSQIKNRDWSVSGTAVLSLPGVDLTSISAYRYQRTHFFEDIGEVGAMYITSDNPRPRHFFYQELRAVSTGEGRFHYIGGATFLDNNLGLISTIALIPPFFTQPTSYERTIVKNWSIYAQGAYDFTDALTLTVSGRYIHEKQSANFFATTFGSAVTESNISVAKKFLPSATLSYKLAGGGNVYARWARGWKGGGVNPVAPPSAFPNPNLGSIFQPETVDTYEIGYRESLADHTIQLTTAAFYNDYKNLQVNATATPAYPQIIYSIVNAGGARTYGVEGELSWRVIEPLTLGINAGYLNAKYKDFEIPPNAVLESFNLSGHNMLYAPKFQLSLTAAVDQPVNDKYRLVGNVLVSHISSTLFAPSGAPGVLPDAVQKGYWLTNLRIGFRTSDDRYGIALYANNLFNQAYTVSASSNGAGNVFNWGNPRIIGGEITAKF